MKTSTIDLFISRAASNIRRAKAHLEQGQKTDAERCTRKADALLGMVRRAQLVAAVDRLERRAA